jgi:class 3 adenylate cyclase/tetratricopeptide (TPR) repeat protein
VCGRSLPADARFCPSCGAPVSATLDTEERRFVTVLFADLVDSTGLAQRVDPERAREVLGRFYEAVTEELRNLRGRPEKFIGDAVMAVFGLQRVHEDDALRAVRAGLAIRGRARRLSEELRLDPPLEVRVGIEAGEAATGGGPSAQLLVTGPVVNAAARLQAAAEPGEVLVGATANELTASAVAYAAPRDVLAKGFDGPLAAHAVEGLTTRSVRRTIPFVGRTRELGTIREVLDRVATARTPAMVTLLGEPGAGKSRLADELLAGVGEAVTSLLAEGQVAAGSATFAPVASVVRQLASIEDHTTPDEAGARLRALVDRCCAADEAERVAASLGLALGLAEPTLDESVFVQDVHAGFRALVEGLARRGPLLLVFEDAQTMSPAMLDLVEGVALRARGIPLLLLVLARPELLRDRPSWGRDVADHVRVTLGPLSDAHATELVRQAGGERIDAETAAPLAARAGGNPFFIIETTGMLLQRGDLPAGAVPPTVQAVVAARIDALSPAARRFARAVSVFFVSFDLDDAVAVTGDPDTAARLHELEEAELLTRGDDGTRRWRYRHQTLRDVAYASLPKRERMRLHVIVAERQLAQGLRSWAADHLERAAIASLDVDPTARALPERARDALIEAGDRARRRMESRSAVERYRRALALAPEDGWGVPEARALAGTGEALYWLGEYALASEALERAVQLGERLDDRWTLALALRFLGDIAINVHADVDEAERLLGRALEAAESIDVPWAIARTLLFAGWVPWTRGDYAAAEPTWRRALAIAREHGDRWAEVRALTSLSIDLVEMERLDEATELIERAAEVADDMGDRFSAAVATVQAGRIHAERGDHAGAIPHFDDGVAAFADLAARWELGDALAARGISERELGRLDDAERDLQRAVRISEELGERQLAGWTWRALARVAESRGDEAGAQERFRRAEREEARRPR